jgi:hypothetical protein
MKKFESGWQKRQRKRELEEVGKQQRGSSHLKRIKSSLRSTMGQDRLANLTLLNIESEILTDLDFQDIIDSFSTLKARRKDF